jgi:hypothetical protein
VADFPFELSSQFGLHCREEFCLCLGYLQLPSQLLDLSRLGLQLVSKNCTARGGLFYLATSSPTTFATSTMSALTINANGYLGIGTTSPTANLGIQGSGQPWVSP